MRDIKDYLEQTNTVLLTKDAFEHLKERASALDKIRTEIEEMTPTYHNPDWSITDLASISDVLKIIDKYKAETEEI